jgi:N-methylhydantoinase B
VTKTAPANPARIEVFRHLFGALAEEMGATLRRAAFSPNIKERRDYSCALFDGAGGVVALGDHMPVHLGAMPMSVSAVRETLGRLSPGDVAAVNDPFHGGTHLPDITLVSAVYEGQRANPLGLVASRAHHADVGGAAPGSMALAREIYEEGLRLPPVLLVRRGERVEDVWRVLLANVRTSRERDADLQAQIASLLAGKRRLLEIAHRLGADAVADAMDVLRAYADRLLAKGIGRIPDGTYPAEDVLDGDGFGGAPIAIKAELRVDGERATVDFRASDDQAEGGVNAVAAIAVSCVRYAFRCVVEELLGVALPAGGGDMDRIEVLLREGSVVSARPPAAVAAGNVETSQRITDVLFEAFSKALPDVIPAQSQGTMNNITVGGLDPRNGEPFAYYETVGGGAGGGPAGPGLSGAHVHMSNSLNTPIEALEHAYPVRVVAYGLRRGSGGRGVHRGGDGLRREVRFLSEARVNLLCERRARGPRGRAGGEDGAPGRDVLRSGGVERVLPAKGGVRVRAGDELVVLTPGGGGWGPPSIEEGVPPP